MKLPIIRTSRAAGLRGWTARKNPHTDYAVYKRYPGEKERVVKVFETKAKALRWVKRNYDPQAFARGLDATSYVIRKLKVNPKMSEVKAPHHDYAVFSSYFGECPSLDKVFTTKEKARRYVKSRHDPRGFHKRWVEKVQVNPPRIARIYVGVRNGKYIVFRSAATPTRKSHGSRYTYVIGPFRTLRGAAFMATYGRNNPHCRSVDEAERLANQK
jgi:hypothetical protein